MGWAKHWRRVHPPELITDSHGNWWDRCQRDDCDLHITRPGEANCHHDDCPDNPRPVVADDIVTRFQGWC